MEDLLDCLNADLLLDNNGVLTINFPDRLSASQVWLHHDKLISSLRFFSQVKRIVLSVSGRQLFPSFKPETLIMIPVESEFQRLVDFVVNHESPVEVTSMVTHKTLLINNKYEPERLIWSPAQLIGFNCLYYWQQTPGDFDFLLQALRQDTRLNAFKFRNLRVDGSMAEYVKDYFLVENFLGDPVRVSVSREWRLL